MGIVAEKIKFRCDDLRLRTFDKYTQGLVEKRIEIAPPNCSLQVMVIGGCQKASRFRLLGLKPGEKGFFVCLFFDKGHI